MQHGGTESGRASGGRRALRSLTSAGSGQGRAAHLSPASPRPAEPRSVTRCRRQSSSVPRRSRGVSPSVRPSVARRPSVRPPGCAERGRRRRPGCGSGSGCQDAVTMATRSAGGSAAPAARGGGGVRRLHPPAQPRCASPLSPPSARSPRGPAERLRHGGSGRGAGQGPGQGPGPRPPLPHQPTSASRKKVWWWQNSSYPEFLMVQTS